jgi:hypothetical protein
LNADLVASQIKSVGTKFTIATMTAKNKEFSNSTETVTWLGAGEKLSGRFIPIRLPQTKHR